MPDPAPSPFSPGELPRVLVGRLGEQARIRVHLDRVHELGEMSGSILVLHAPRGLGKTSLLREAQTRAEELGFVTAWLSCAKGGRLVPELVHSVQRALDRAEVFDSRSRRTWRASVSRLGLELGVVGVKVSTDVDLTPKAPQAPVGAVGALEDLLHDAASLVRRRGGAGLLVLVDELHSAPFGELSVLLNAAQNLAGERADNPLAIMVAGLPSTPEAMTRAATFGERSDFVPLDRFDEDDARLVLTRPAGELGVTWDPEALARALEIGDGYPYLLQLVGHTTWQAAAPAEGDRLTAADVAAGQQLVDAQLAAMFRARWDGAPRLEQELMAAMATQGTDVVPRAAVAAAMGRESRAISVPRARLIDRGVIEAAGRGMLRFTLPGMVRWIREEIDAPPP
jgi:hypothetical protein